MAVFRLTEAWGATVTSLVTSGPTLEDAKTAYFKSVSGLSGVSVSAMEVAFYKAETGISGSLDDLERRYFQTATGLSGVTTSAMKYQHYRSELAVLEPWSLADLERTYYLTFTE